jgi:hypothetical protein
MNETVVITPEIQKEIDKLESEYMRGMGLCGFGDLYDEMLAHQAIDNVIERNKRGANASKLKYVKSPAGFLHRLWIAFVNLLTISIVSFIALPIIQLIIQVFSRNSHENAGGSRDMPWYSFCPCVFAIFLAILLFAFINTNRKKKRCIFAA